VETAVYARSLLTFDAEMACDSQRKLSNEQGANTINKAENVRDKEADYGGDHGLGHQIAQR